MTCFAHSIIASDGPQLAIHKEENLLPKVLQLLQVQEFFGDFVVMDSQHFCVPLPRPHVVLQPFSWDYANSTDAVTRMTEGLASLTLSLRRRFSIRCCRIASLAIGGVGCLVLSSSSGEHDPNALNAACDVGSKQDARTITWWSAVFCLTCALLLLCIEVKPC